MAETGRKGQANMLTADMKIQLGEKRCHLNLQMLPCHWKQAPTDYMGTFTSSQRTL